MCSTFTAIVKMLAHLTNGVWTSYAIAKRCHDGKKKLLLDLDFQNEPEIK